MKKIISCLVLAFSFVLSSCGTKATPANYYLNESGDLIVEYDNGSTENLGDYEEELINSLGDVAISNDGYYVINGVKTNIEAKTVTGYEITEDGELIVIYSDGTKENLGELDNTLINGIDTITISNDGYYVINGVKTNIVAKQSYTITFDAGFDIEIDDQIVTEGKKVTRPEIYRTGYTLIGWFCNGEEWRFNSDLVLNDMELKAEWSVNSYTVKFDTNNEFDLDDMLVQYDSTFELPVLSKLGYTFVGWLYEDQIINDAVWSIADNVTLTAQWSRDVYQISFDTQGGETIDPINVESYSTIEELPTPSKQDYEFLGWYLNEELIDLPYNFTEGDIELVARWKGISESYEFDLDDSGNGIKITKYLGTDEDVVVPEKIANKYVTTICTNAFDNQSITSITFGPKVREFEYKCFDGLVNLKEINIAGDTVATLIYMFGGEELIPSTLVEVNFVDGTETYGKQIFDKLSSDRTFVVHVYSKLKTTPEDAFYECPNIREVYFEEGITEFSDRTICANDNLEYVNIPNTVTSIGMNCFINVPKLKYLIVPKSVLYVEYGGLAATQAIIFVEATSRPSGWSGSAFSIYEDEMDILYGFEEIRENNDFVYALCKVGSVKQSIIIENKTNAPVPELLDGYPITERKNK